MDLAEIKSFMPHREPMLLIEHAEITGEGEAYATYRIKEDEFFTRGHFPGNPIVPGVILCEIMAQSCAVSVKDFIPGHMTLYAGIDKVRFKNAVKPRSGQSSSQDAVRSSSSTPNSKWTGSFAARAN